MHRFGELIMQWPSESDARTTEPGQRVAMVWALWTVISSCWDRGVMDEFQLERGLLSKRRDGVEAAS